MTPTLQDQLEREQEMVFKGIRLYRERLLKTPICDQTKGIILMKKTMESLSEAIRVFRIPKNMGKTDKKAYKFINNELTMTDDEIAYITLKAAMMCLGENTMIARAAIELTDKILDHHEYTKFKNEHKGLVHLLEENLSNISTYAHKRRLIMLKKRQRGVEDTEISHQDKLAIGITLYDLLIESTGLFYLEQFEGFRASEMRYYVRGSEALYQWLEAQDDVLELLTPYCLPTIIPPKRWESPTIGGYYSDAITMRNKLVKTRDRKHISRLWHTDLSRVYEAVNTIQETPWAINKDMLQILGEVWSAGSTLGDIPPAEIEELPTKPWDSDEEGNRLRDQKDPIFMTWKKAAAEVYDSRIRTRGKRSNLITMLQEGKELAKLDRFYYPHNIDFRGRIYPIATVGGLNPQSYDSGKALLQFADGKALGEQGWYWLRVHGANCYGYDKAQFDDRVQWCRDHHIDIIESAKNPLDYHFWCDADSPYCFLAFCLDYAKAQSLANPYGHISHLPVAMDGSCNGLQNFSALLLDDVGGKAVNLIPSDKPQDIYGVVAQRVSDVVVREALEGDEMAKLWVGKVDRKMAKRNVMTLPYGAKKFGFKDQLMQELDSREKRYLDTDDYYKPAIYLADRMYNGIGEVVIAARDAMDWLQKTSRVVNSMDQAIYWTTPVGFVVKQKYMKTELKRINTFWGKLNVRIDLGLKLDTDKLDKNKQANSISPNFIHSLDAAHLMSTVLRMKSAGINQFAMIHDSYGCLAADVAVMNKELREAFVQMYSEPVLNNFREEILRQLPEELHKEVPEIPPMGTLDINEVRNSKYFFA